MKRLNKIMLKILPLSFDGALFSLEVDHLIGIILWRNENPISHVSHLSTTRDMFRTDRHPRRSPNSSFGLL